MLKFEPNASVWRLLILSTLGLLGSVMPAPAERYLTVIEAQELSFPQADRFEAQVVRFSKEHSRAIERKSGIKVRNRGNRMSVAYQDAKILGVLIVDRVMGKHELIDYAVAVSPVGQVLLVEVLEYRESHGTEIRSKKWRSQFAGKTSDSRLRLHDDVYNISGATISCRQITDGIKRVLATYALVVRPRLVLAERKAESEFAQ